MSRLTEETSARSAGSLVGLFGRFKGKPDSQFLDTIQSVADADVITDVMEAAMATQGQAEDLKGVGGELEGDPLPLNNLCSILKYCAEDTEPAFYREMNQRCHNKDRTAIRPFLPFMYLLMKTLEKLPPYEGTVVFRGVAKKLIEDYPEGKKVVWHSFTSTTKSMKTLDNPMFLGKAGDRTIFHIELRQKQARDISKFSPLEEGEVLLPPGCRFQVTSSLNAGHGLCMISLLELPSPALIMDLCPKTSVSPEDLVKIFTRFDLDGNGKISRRELSIVLVQIGMSASDTEIIISQADRNNDGDVDFAEFSAWIMGGSKEANELPVKFMASSSQEDIISMWHGTSEANARVIARTGQFLPSEDGFMGPGVYVTSSKKKAWAWAMTHSKGGFGPNFYEPNRPRPFVENVAVISVRVACGRCKKIRCSENDVQVHMARYCLDGFRNHLGQLGGTAPAPPGMTAAGQGGDPYHSATRYANQGALQSWIAEGYDSQYALDALPERAMRHAVGDGGCGVERNAAQLRLLLKGDELVVSNGRRVTYQSHEVRHWRDVDKDLNDDL